MWSIYIGGKRVKAWFRLHSKFACVQQLASHSAWNRYWPWSELCNVVMLSSISRSVVNMHVFGYNIVPHCNHVCICNANCYTLSFVHVISGLCTAHHAWWAFANFVFCMFEKSVSTGGGQIGENLRVLVTKPMMNLKRALGTDGTFPTHEKAQCHIIKMQQC